MSTYKPCRRCGMIIASTGRDPLCPDCRALFIQLTEDKTYLDSLNIDNIPTIDDIASIYDIEDLEIIQSNMGYDIDIL